MSRSLIQSRRARDHERTATGGGGLVARGAIVVVATATILLISTGCDTRTAASTADRGADGRPLVVTTTTMITDLAGRIGGDRVRVIGIMPPGTDPHIYDPRPDDSVLFRKAALVLYNGLHLEGKMVQIIENAGSRAVALAEDPRIVVRKSAASADAPDPHCWWNVRNFMIYAERARDALVRLDPAGEAEYRKRTDAYLEELRQADAEVRAAIQRIAAEQRYLITSHDAFYYFGEAYGLKVDAVLGISTDADVRALRTNELARIVVAHRIPAIFHETSVSSSLNEMIDRVVELAARDGHSVRVPKEMLYSDSLGPPGTRADTYIGAVRENARIIVTALAGPGAAAGFSASNGPTE
jgi:manganese/zinc/iron transport system substrate-binding protein